MLDNILVNKKSGPYQVSYDDLKKWAVNTAIFLAPAALLFLLALQSGKSFQEALVIIELWGLNTAIDLVRKFIADNKKK